jgi:peptidoglycan/LPS O-acetylase OafA/YrhL
LTKTLSRIAGADGLRAIACLLVVWHHTSQKFNPENAPSLVKGIHYLGMRGEVGVSLFFVLSGCLLSLPFWNNFVSNKEFPSLSVYARNRIARIAPAFWINLVVCALLSYFLFELGFDYKRFFSSALFVNSYHYSTFFPSEINGPLWSIGLEVSCYILLPLVLYSVIKSSKKVSTAFLGLTLWIIALQIANPFIIEQFMTGIYRKGWQYGMVGGAKEWLPYWNVSTFFSQFLLGSMAALIIVTLNSRDIKSRNYFDIAGFLSVALAVYLVVERLNPGSPDSFTRQPYVAPVFAFLMAATLVFINLGLIFTRVLDNRVFLWLAKLSFSIYLWHMVVMELIARKLLSTYVYYGLNNLQQWVAISTIVLAISIAIAAVSWRWIEEPILRFNRKRLISINR